jgi:2-polyprenyl-3-methyl-5-hydroxy-6-metoxy-1,4-benzoquinol methylase
MNEIIKKQLEAYQPNFLKYGDSPKGTFQNNTTTQYERFEQLLAPLLRIKPEGFSICDIGSGVCDLHQYLLQKNIAHEYTGIEIVPEMVATAQEKYPEITLMNVDITSEEIPQRFDFVVISGTLNILGSVAADAWEEFVYQLVQAAFHLSTIGLSFNGLTTYSTFRAEDLYYLSPEQTFGFIQRKLSRFCTLNTASPLFEVSYAVFQPSFMATQYAHPDFKKYFPDA